MIFEAIMLICFGLAWPFSIFKSFKAKKIVGKSIGFLYLLLLGYISGIIYKIHYNYDPVIYLYVLNGLMVGIDIFLFHFKNKKYS